MGIKNKRYILNATYIIVICCSIASCKKFVQIDPSSSELVTRTVYENDATAVAAISGVYREMINSAGLASGTSSGISSIAGLSADEFLSFSINYNGFVNNDLLPQNETVKTLWSSGYKYIYYCNAVLEGLGQSQNISAALKTQLEGEARFLRAFSYLYLTDLFGDIPLTRSTDYRVNNSINKTAQSDVYQFIIEELQSAKDVLASDYSLFGGNRVRATKWAASALLARVYLYTGDWAKSETEASTVINETGLFVFETDLNKVFLANSTEAIFQLMPVQAGYNTWDAMTFILMSTPSSVSLSDEFVNSIESGDQRKADWIGQITVQSSTYFYPYKYKLRNNTPLSEYSMVLRLSELYLIRAEARAKQNNIPDAIADIDIIRDRAQLPLINDTDPTISQSNMLLAIEKERRVELFSEWGHRWFDLKRTKRATDILEPLKGANWQASDTLYPIPQSEINNNSNLLPQNSGYN